MRQTFGALVIEHAQRSEPEDHVSIICEIMAGLIGGSIAAPAGADRWFFKEHVTTWAQRFFVDLEDAQSATFYASVGALGRTFILSKLKAIRCQIRSGEAQCARSSLHA
ncbi:molecular chaperone TorD family protein [Bradyrhizobium sp. 139]|uniref:TorD/DmsD family molecular chaperone n=1 Tax=Bradyrhizobium sp. 139 TaxID=2782616 RepID=UPI0020984421|nr:molecular chaperone TorD family protein [Bradyrhizobium sp. 139]